MTDITLFITDPSLRRLIRLELERIGKTVSENGEDSRIFITDTRNALRNSHQNQILISRDPQIESDIVVLRRPVDMEELRVAIARFSSNSELKSESTPANDNSLKLLKDEKAVLINGLKMPLTENEFILLSALLEKRGDPISRDAVNVLLNSGGNTPEVYICNLRKKLSSNDGRNPIITVRCKGYAIRQ